MTWYNPNTWFNDEEKLNPVQEIIIRQEGSQVNSDALAGYATAFDKLETVNRGTSMIVSACSSLDYDVKDKTSDGVVSTIRQKSLVKLLNFAPNPFQSAQDFRISLFTDFILEGNMFIYFDGAHLFHLPAASVVVHPDPKTFVSHYSYQGGSTTFKPNEIIHIRDLNSTSIYRGTSRLAAADRNIRIVYQMLAFQELFFKNGAVPGLVLTTDNTLSQVAKDKSILNWVKNYSPTGGAKKPIILDSGLKPFTGLQSNFQEMDFDVSIKTHDVKILKALGIPPILLDGGNNANISPNLRLFYLETVMPAINKLVSGLERFFGYDIAPITATVSSLQPELKDLAAYFSTLVNTGIITANEAREELRYDKDTDAESDKLRIPANIAGSAANPAVGGKPKVTTPDKE